MLEIKKSYLLVMSVKVEPMALAEFNSTVKEENENLTEVGYSVVCDGAAQFLTKEQFVKYCREVSDMKFSSMIEWLKLGFKATRGNWVNGRHIKLATDGLYIVDNNNNNKFYPSLCDLEAADWHLIIE
ncbi:MAG: hypothetical protein ACMV0I_09365 [Pseudomonas sp.]